MLERFVFRWAKSLPSTNAVGFLFPEALSPHDSKRVAFCTKKSRHASAHERAFHAFIIYSLQHFLRVGAASPLAVTSEDAPRSIPSQAICWSLYQRPLDIDLAVATLIPRDTRFHPRIVNAGELGICRIPV